MYSTSKSEPNTSETRLLKGVIFALYVFFTLIPDSNTLMVQWPWVFFWQTGLLCLVFWLLAILWSQRKIQALGNGLDWVVGLTLIGLIISTLFAQFPNQARWYAWAALCMLAALYCLNHWLCTPKRRYQLLVKQGYLNIAFIIVSLTLWTTQTLLPQLARLNTFKQYGVNLSFDFSVLELRNWAPLGHQNYVAGYLLLAIPLLVSLSILETSKKRWLWFSGVGLGLLDLYTTSSKGGWLGLAALFVFAVVVLLLKSNLPRLWLGIGSFIAFIIILLLALTNNRLLLLIKQVISGQTGGELAYRLINTDLGWRMGIEHPFSGIGLGNVPLLYQKYRPIWAGRESELAYQLHSTPVQLWAELGIWGIFPLLEAVILLTYALFRYATPLEKTDQIFIWGLSGALLGYGMMSLTDYQLDNISISATLVIYIACLASIYRSCSPLPVGEKAAIKDISRYGLMQFYGIIGIVLAVIIWLIPIHRAWQLSSQGFMALSEKKVNLFVNSLTQAHQLAAWEPYYPYQLGWNLSNLAFQTQNPQQQQQLLSEGIGWFEKANQVSPYQEFGYNNLGWLILNNFPAQATEAFTQAIKLVPAKPGLMYGLGLSLLAQNKTDLAIEAIALEGLRNLLFISSPIWRAAQTQPIYHQVIERMLTHYTELIKQYSESPLKTYLHSARGGLWWWQGKLKEAHQDLDTYGSPLSQNFLKLLEGKSPQSVLSELPSSPASLILKAWITPQQPFATSQGGRANLIEQAWIEERQEELPSALKQEFLNSMEQSKSFEQWLKQKAPVLQSRFERLGFGVLSRHIDGPIPSDFFPVVENVAITTWFSELLPTPIYYPELDLALQPLRDNLLQQIQK